MLIESKKQAQSHKDRINFTDRSEFFRVKQPKFAFSTFTIILFVISIAAFAVTLVLYKARQPNAANIVLAVWAIALLASFAGVVADYLSLQSRQKKYQQKLVNEWHKNHEQIVFDVVGTAFFNPDGSSRQQYLKSAYNSVRLNQTPSTDIKSNPDGTLAVIVQGYRVGDVPANLTAQVKDMIPRLEEVEPYITTKQSYDAGSLIYGMRITLTAHR